MQSKVFVGSKQIQVEDKDLGISFPVLIHYPTYEPSSPTAFGPYVMDVKTNAEIIEGKFPLIMISHGNGGSHLLYRSISTHLAKHGYVVAMVEHYGNNRNNNSLENSIENLQYRPKHISLTINALLSLTDLSASIDSEKISMTGHSMGGYTALALAGGIPRTRDGQVVEVISDERIKAIVLLAPGAGWFMNSLDKVTIPIFILTAEHDPVTPSWNADVVMKGVPDPSKVIHKEIKNGGHFSFLSPFPVEMKRPGFLPAIDPEGFDREKFHNELPSDILAFLNKSLDYKTALDDYQERK